MSTRNVALTLGLLMAALAIPPSAGAQESSAGEGNVFAGVTFPSVVDTFQVMRVARWPDPALGVALTYMAPGIPSELSVYVYPASQDLKAEFDQAMQGISVYAEQNRDGVTVTIDGEEPVELTAADQEVYSGWKGTTTMRRGSRAQQSLLYVFEKDGGFVKYRVSYGRELRALMEERVETFLEETLESVGAAGG